MKKFEGKIVSVGMNQTVVVEIFRRFPHPLYKKLIKRSKKYLVDSNNLELSVGDMATIVEIRPISKNKYFKVSSVKGAKKVKSQAPEAEAKKTKDLKEQDSKQVVVKEKSVKAIKSQAKVRKARRTK